jgi:TolB-like protein
VNPTNFLTELKRRNVYRAAIAYGVVAWFLTQLTTQVFPLFEIPNSAMRFVVIALAVGFPIAMLLSWLYEFTPEGIVRTEDLHPAQARSIQRATGRILDFIIIGALLLVIAMLIVGRLPFYRQTGASIPQKSIAVLPLENLSGDPDNAYFADGIQKEILTRLAGIADLKVISRSSTQQYQSKPRNLREIARQLGVANFLEGSVQKAADRVRVNVQLVNAQSDSHLWAETYDRKLTDIFGAESEIAKGIAESLQAKLTSREEKALAVKPTYNPEAYDAYLRAAYLAFVQAHNLADPFENLERLRQSEQLYERAIELDPNFALAIARYSQLESWIVHDRERTVERREKARTLANRALQLQPNLPEAHLALGFSYYYGDNDYDAALKAFEIARRGLPNESEVYMAIGAIQRRQGNWAESTANLEKAVSLSPKDIFPLHNLTFNYWILRDFTKANQTMDRVIALDPTALDP